MVERLLQDTRFALRLLWKDRGFTVTALLTLAVCIGADTAIFTVVNSVLLRPLPVPESERLVLMYNAYPLVLGAVGTTLALVAFIACAVPARRAARIDTLVVLIEQ
jgi:ABC-type lipoprotein release transport system permease subunit